MVVAEYQRGQRQIQGMQIAHRAQIEQVSGMHVMLKNAERMLIQQNKLSSRLN